MRTGVWRFDTVRCCNIYTDLSGIVGYCENDIMYNIVSILLGFVMTEIVLVSRFIFLIILVCSFEVVISDHSIDFALICTTEIYNIEHIYYVNTCSFVCRTNREKLIFPYCWIDMDWTPWSTCIEYFYSCFINEHNFQKSKRNL